MKKLMMMAVGCALAFAIAGCGKSSVANTPQELASMFGKALVQQDKDALLKLCTSEAASGEEISELLKAFDDEKFKAEVKELQGKNPVFSGEIKEPKTPDMAREIEEKFGAGAVIVEAIITVDGRVSTGPCLAAKKVDGSWKVIDCTR